MTPESHRHNRPGDQAPEAARTKQVVRDFLSAQGIQFQRAERLEQALTPWYLRGKERLAHEHLAYVGDLALAVANAEILFTESLPADDGRLLEKALNQLNTNETRLHLARKAHLGRLVLASAADEVQFAPQLLAALTGALLLDGGISQVSSFIRKLYGDPEMPASYVASLRLQFFNTFLPSVSTCSHSHAELRESMEINFAPDKLNFLRDALGQERNEEQRKLRFSRVAFVGDKIVAAATRCFVSQRFPAYNRHQLHGAQTSPGIMHIDDFDRPPGRTGVSIGILDNLRFDEFLTYRGHIRALIGALYLSDKRDEAWRLAGRFVPLLERPPPGSSK